MPILLKDEPLVLGTWKPGDWPHGEPRTPTNDELFRWARHAEEVGQRILRVLEQQEFEKDALNRSEPFAPSP